MEPRRLRAPVIALIGLALSLLLVACTKYVSHETFGQSYDAIDASGGSYNLPGGASPADPPPTHYEGSGEAWAHLDSSSTGARRNARGTLNAYLDSQEGYYGAAFYFPPGTLRGSARDQQGKLQIMSWKNSTGDTGGVRVGNDGKAYMFRKQGGGTDPPETDQPVPDSSFVLREGCWNWVAVHQKLSDTSSGVNEVYLNGRRVVNSAAPNAYPSTGVPRQVRFGLSAVDTNQTSAIDAFVDYPYISNKDLIPPRATACEDRPNILFLLTDDQRTGMENVADPNPGGTVWMPNLKKWMKDGTSSVEGGKEFSDAYATTSRCCPSRASIFSGRYAHNTGVKINQEARFLDQTNTVQRYLKDAGYKTAMFGKFLNGWIRQDLGNPTFWDTWSVVDGGAYYAQPGRNCASVGAGGAECVNEDGTMKPLDPGVYLTDYLTDRAENFIDAAEASDGQPWFLDLAPTAPHAGHDNTYTLNEVKTDYRNIQTPAIPDNPASFEDDLTGKPPHVLEQKDIALRPESDPNHFVCPESVPPGTPQSEVYKVCVRQHRDVQFKMLKSVDDMVEGIFQKLRATGEEDNTLVIFASDNGYLWGEHWLDGKVQAYSQSVRVPMSIRWPGHIDSGGLDSRLVANIDMTPTALAATGVSAPPRDGRSLLDSTARNRLLLESWGNIENMANMPSWAATVTPTYQYHENYVGQTYNRTSLPQPQPNANTFYEYYDQSADPWQLNNYFGADGWPDGGDPPTALSPSALSAQLAADRTCAGANCP